MGQTFELEEHPQVAARKLNGATVGARGTPGAGLVAQYMPELDEMRERIQRFPAIDPSDVLAELSAISGRLAEMRAQLYRDNSQRAQALRTREIDPLREECEMQFKIHSRRIALMEWELRMSGGGT
ncbi:hypothetical protein [Caudovirales GX15bay]|nr:hypothetical protein [Caudovirales GX15bay]